MTMFQRPQCFFRVFVECINPSGASGSHFFRQGDAEAGIVGTPNNLVKDGLQLVEFYGGFGWKLREVSDGLKRVCTLRPGPKTSWK